MNSYKHPLDNHGNSEHGTRAELLFKQMAKNKKWVVKESLVIENGKEHWDIALSNEKYNHKIDVKAVKSIKRGEPFQDDLIWIEFHGDDEFNNGWLHGKADFIAFETFESFLIVHRETLLHHATTLVDFTKIVSDPHLALYCIYNRNGKFDKTSLIKREDVENIVSKIWYKKEI